MSARLDQAITVGLLAVIVFTALAHGAIEPWSVALFELSLVALLLLWGIKIVVDKQLVMNIPAAAFPLIAFLALGLAQSIVLTGQDGRRLSLSMNVEITRVTVTIIFFSLAAFLMAANFLMSRARLRMLTKFIVVFGLAMAVFGLVQKLAWNGRFYWLRVASEDIASPFGPFFNHSRFAGYLELLLPVPVALIMTRSLRLEARIFYGFAAVMMGVATIASLSRGGMISLVAELMFIAILSVRLAREREDVFQRNILVRRSAGAAHYLRLFSQAGVILTIALTITLGILWIGPEPVVNRVTQGSLASAEPQKETLWTSRGWIWRDTLTMIRKHPLIGVGLGAFETAYPIYSQSDGSLLVNAAHNDYLQVLAEGGVIGGALILWFIIAIFRATSRGLRSRDPWLAGLALGSSASIFGMLVHSLFDFNLQFPSHALVFVLLSAVVSHLGAKVPQAVAEGAREFESREKPLVSVIS